MNRLCLICLVIVFLSQLVLVGCGKSIEEIAQQRIAEDGWMHLSDGLTTGGSILSSRATGVFESLVQTLVQTLVEMPEELASAYIDASYPLDDCSSELSRLGADGTATIVASMAMYFRDAGNGLADGDFVSVADALSDLAGQFEVLADPVLEDEVPAIWEALQNTIQQFTLQAEIARMISDPSPWVDQLEVTLDFYDAHTIEELQGFASALLTEVTDPEERARFGLDDPEMVGALGDLSMILTSEDFQEWIDIAGPNLSGWLNQASQETFILQTKELGDMLSVLGQAMEDDTDSVAGSAGWCPDECPMVDVTEDCQVEVRFSAWIESNPDQRKALLAVMYTPTKTPAAGGPLRKAIVALEDTLMEYSRIAVWLKATWDRCREKGCAWSLWLSSRNVWVEQTSSWIRVDPTPGNEAVSGAWHGRRNWTQAYEQAMNDAITAAASNACPD